MRIGYAPELGRTGVDPEVARLCRDAALGLQRHGAAVEEIAVDFSDGRDAFITLRGEAMVGNHLVRVDKLDVLDPNLAGNIRLGLEVKIGDIARAEHKRAEIWHRWRVAVRAVRPRADADLPGAAVPGGAELSVRDRRAEARELHRLGRRRRSSCRSPRCPRRACRRARRRPGCRSACRSSGRASRSRGSSPARSSSSATVRSAGPRTRRSAPVLPLRAGRRCTTMSLQSPSCRRKIGPADPVRA